MFKIPIMKFYFIARPQKFGKSLFCRTLETIFLGKKQLFEGLSIHDAPHDWEVYPVIYLSYASFGNQSENYLNYAKALVGELKLKSDYLQETPR